MMFYDSDILNLDDDIKNYWLDDDIQNCSKVLTCNRTELRQKVKLIKKNMYINNELKKDNNQYFTNNSHNQENNKINNKINNKKSPRISRKKNKKLNYI